MDPDNESASKQTQAENNPPAATEVFRTPEEVAADEPLGAPSGSPVSVTDKAEKPASGWRQSWKEKMTLHWPPGKKEWITAAVILLLVGGSIAAYALTHNKPATIRPIPKVTAQTKTVPSTLTGLPVDPIVNKRTVTGVMIENSIWARPQSGLGQAGVVFEAIAEGGITRFLALYQDTAPNNVGPIRSARPYYEEWNLGFDAGYAHVGGSPEALADIKAWHVRDLDEFANAGAYHRISTRDAPHNVYTSIAALNQLEVAKGFTTSKYTGFARKNKAAPHRPKPTAANISLTLSGPTYDVQYSYNPKTNSYDRSEGGARQIDANTNKRVSPVVVIALVMHYSFGALDSSGAYYSEYNTLGKGIAYVFQDGQVYKGTWIKTSGTSQFKFINNTGKTISLNPGQTWLTAVAGSSLVSYSP